jgi:hypothetical protein
MIPDVYVRSVNRTINKGDPLVLALKANGNGSHLCVHVRMGTAAAAAAATATCDFLIRLFGNL